MFIFFNNVSYPRQDSNLGLRLEYFVFFRYPATRLRGYKRSPIPGIEPGPPA